jgi:hypothetical protein
MSEADRRAGNKNAPHVPTSRGAKPRARNKDGSWRAKRRDARNARSKGKSPGSKKGR